MLLFPPSICTGTERATVGLPIHHILTSTIAYRTICIAALPSYCRYCAGCRNLHNFSRLVCSLPRFLSFRGSQHSPITAFLLRPKLLDTRHNLLLQGDNVIGKEIGGSRVKSIRQPGYSPNETVIAASFVNPCCLAILLALQFQLIPRAPRVG